MAGSKSLGSLEVTFRGNADQLVTEGKRANEAVKGVDKTATSTAAGFVKSFGLMAAATAGVALAIKGLNAVMEAGEIKDLARNANLSTKAFQELTYATDKAGIAQEAVAKASKTFALNLSQLKSDTGQLNEFLSDHLSTLQAELRASKSQEQAYRLVADALARLRSEGDRTALATKLFGEAGADLVDVLKEGSAGLDENAAKAKALNIIMSDESIKAADKLSEKYRELTSNLERWWMKAATGVAGYISSVTDAVMTPARNVNSRTGGAFGAQDRDFDRMLREAEPLGDGKKAKGGSGLDLEKKETLTEWADAQERLNTLIANNNQLLDEGRAMTEGLRTPQEEMAARLEKINELQRAGAIDAKTAARAQAEAAQIVQDQYTDAASAISGALAMVFEKNKGVAIANALVNTYQAVTKALASNVGYPMNFALAAAAAAQGFAAVRSIQSTSKSSGGGGAAPAASGGASSAAAAGGGQPGGGRTDTLVVRGLGTNALFDTEAVKVLAGKLVDAQRDGVQVVLAPR
jgi:uncharacterized protein YjgD (DUF1641 family)